MKINHRNAHETEELTYSTARLAEVPRLKKAAKKVANYLVVLLK